MTDYSIFYAAIIFFQEGENFTLGFSVLLKKYYLNYTVILSFEGISDR